MPSLVRWRAVAMLAGLLATADCARPAVQAAAVPRSNARYGTIMAMRPAATARADVRGAILRAIGPAPAGPDAPAEFVLVEFIVRADNGDTLSVMQGDADRLRAGERVTVMPGAPTRLARAIASGG